MGDEKMRKIMGKSISLEMALKSKNMNVQGFTQKLIEVIEQNRQMVDYDLVHKRKGGEDGDIKIDGVLPCPVRVPLTDAFNTWLEEEGVKLGFKVDYELKAAAGGIDWIKEGIQKIRIPRGFIRYIYICWF